MNRIVAGLDLGSRTIKLVVFEGNDMIDHQIQAHTHDPINTARALLKSRHIDIIVATGYGRHLFKSQCDCDIITEIRAIALGMRYYHPDVRTILDIGGQDTKVIALNQEGAVIKFEMNDKCAAGTGRFLEVMAGALDWKLDQFIEEACRASEKHSISSMCTVFAESEIISLAAQGVSKSSLALGIHHSIANRAISMLSKIPLVNEMGFCGGPALNQSLVRILARHFNRTLKIPDNPQLTAATGCVLHFLTRTLSN